MQIYIHLWWHAQTNKLGTVKTLWANVLDWETLQNDILWICLVWNLIVLSLSLSLHLYLYMTIAWRVLNYLNKQAASLYIWISNQEVTQPGSPETSLCILYLNADCSMFIGPVEITECCSVVESIIIESLRVDLLKPKHTQRIATDKLVSLRSEVLVCHCRHNFCWQHWRVSASPQMPKQFCGFD